MESIFFTVINPNTEEETRINLSLADRGMAHFQVNDLLIDAQQLAELSILLFALANRYGAPDLDSCNELLEGFDIPFPTKPLQELINIEREFNGT